MKEVPHDLEEFSGELQERQEQRLDKKHETWVSSARVHLEMVCGGIAAQFTVASVARAYGETLPREVYLALIPAAVAIVTGLRVRSLMKKQKNSPHE